jgi:RNA polymerase sigma factor (sigma-70 family)
MTLRANTRALDEVAAALPFAIDDYKAVNLTFVRWREEGSDADYETLQKWIYCYSRRYLIIKFLRLPQANPADIEEPIGDAFRRARRHMTSVDNPDRFASYVSVICKNVFVSYCRTLKRAQRVEMDLDLTPASSDSDIDPFEAADRSVLLYVVQTAIDRLPEWLRTVARMRLVDGEEYEAIEQATGFQRATLRAYTSKAVNILREDPLLIDFLEGWRDSM